MLHARISTGESQQSPDETSPLLRSTDIRGAIYADEITQIPDLSNDEQTDDHDDRPLPRSQIALLCFDRVIEVLGFFSIFPFISQMVWENGELEKDGVGFYSGLIESLYSVTQMLVMIPWASAANRFGKKPVLVLALTASAIALSLFGLSKNLWQMILFRCLAGACAGSIVITRSMITDISTPHTEARAFSYFSSSGNMGIPLGSVLGGALAKPARQFPSVFGGLRFFVNYPYALATFVVGGFGFFAAMNTLFFIKETRDFNKDKAARVGQVSSTWDIMTRPDVGFVLLLFSNTMLLAFASSAIFTVFWFTPVHLGGYSFSPLQISLLMAINGTTQAIATLLLFPPLQKRYGTGGVLRVCFLVYPFVWVLSPIGNLLLKHDLTIIFWIVMPFNQVLNALATMAWTAMQLAINNIAPTPADTGKMNSLSLTFMSGVRAFTPALFGSIYAESVKRQILGGHFIWVLMIALTLVNTIGVFYLPVKAEGKKKPVSKSRQALSSTA